MTHPNPQVPGDRCRVASAPKQLVGREAVMRVCSELGLDGLDMAGAPQPPVEVLVGAAALRRHMSGIITRSTEAKLPEGSLIPIELPTQGPLRVFVASPELVFMQLASLLSPLDAIAVGYALCSSYLLDPIGKGGVRERRGEDSPLATRASIADYLARAKGAKGSAKASRALRFVLEGSRSPMESGLAMAFGLPARYGGFALGELALNEEMSIYDGLDIWGNPRYKPRAPDIRIEARAKGGSVRTVLFDYDADSTHAGRKEARRDAARRNEFQTLGEAPHFSMTSDQANDYRALAKTADQIRRALGRRRARSGALCGPNRSADAAGLLAALGPNGLADAAGMPAASGPAKTACELERRRVALRRRFVSAAKLTVGTPAWANDVLRNS